MKKEFSIGLEYSKNGIIVRQENVNKTPLVELIEKDYKQLIDKLGCILWSQFKDFYSDRIKLTIKVDEL